MNTSHLLKILLSLTLLLSIITACQTNPTATPTPIPPTHTPLPIATATQIPPLPVEPLFRGNPERTGVYAQSGDFGNWKWYAGAPITGSPVLVDGTLFIGTMQGRLYALDPATQSVKWQADLPAPI
ncbi:MAG: PQQ-like domain, partial [Chloroflexi bacterium]|nr:PQQ-like domain [Chloroflexota bacterium]